MPADPRYPRLAHVSSSPARAARKTTRPSLGSAKGRGQEPRAVNQIETRPPSRWVNALRSTSLPAPQSKPVAHAARLVAQVAPSVAFGPGVRILAAGPAHLRLYSDCRRYVHRSSNLPELGFESLPLRLLK